MLKAPVCRDAEGVSQQHLFGKTENKDAQSHIKIVKTKLLSGNILKLRKHFFVADDRTGYQLWKKGDKKRIIGDGMSGYAAAGSIYQKAYLLEGEKTNAKGQKDIGRNGIHMEQTVYVFNQKAEIFEVKEDSKIAQNTSGQDSFWANMFQHQDMAQVVQGDACKNDT